MTTLESPYAPYVNWGAILGGAVLATAFSVVMLKFGMAIGLSATEVTSGEAIVTPGRVFAVGFWILWIQVLASLMGGYLAGRLRNTVPGASALESEVRDGAHGLLVWATATLAVVVAVSVAAAFAALAPAEAQPAVIETPELLANREAVSSVAAFSAGATALVSAVASWWAATKGGDHRDSGYDVARYLSFR